MADKKRKHDPWNLGFPSENAIKRSAGVPTESNNFAEIEWMIKNGETGGAQLRLIEMELLQPGDEGRIHYLLARIYFKRGKYKAAFRNIGLARGASPHNKRYGSFHDYVLKPAYACSRVWNGLKALADHALYTPLYLFNAGLSFFSRTSEEPTVGMELNSMSTGNYCRFEFVPKGLNVSSSGTDSLDSLIKWEGRSALEGKVDGGYTITRGY